MKNSSEAPELQTLRDLLRYAVSRFGAAKLVYGHGTTSAIDEAAFLLLTHLHLPIDSLEPWLDARLTGAELKSALALIAARITTRKPAPYLVNSAWIGPYEFYVDERVIVPRSYLGELLNEGLEDRLGASLAPSRILDLCTGSGCLAIIAAHAYPGAEVVGADISPDALAVAKINVERHGLTGRVRLVESDLFDALGGETFDLILTNPPYVTEAAVAAFPAEYQAEPVLAHLGGVDGMDVARRILAESASHLTANGWLVAEVGTGRETLEAGYPALPLFWLDSAEADAEVFAIERRALVKPAAAKSRSEQSTAMPRTGTRKRPANS